MVVLEFDFTGNDGEKSKPREGYIPPKTAHNVVPMIGLRFGMLLVLSRAGKSKDRKALWNCICDCGNTKVANGKLMRNGTVSSCGCLQIDFVRGMATKHGHKSNNTYTVEFTAWQNMKRRCLNKKNSHYKYYGGRGILVCERWVNSFENFFKDMGLRPSKNHSLDRIDVNGNYEPTNCRWATVKQQANNSRRNIFITYYKKKKTLSEWADFLNVTNDFIKYHYQKGVSFKQIVKMSKTKQK